MKGSYTVEAAVVFPIVLYVIVFILYSAFYINNVVVINEAAYETAIYGTTLNRSRTEDMKTKMQSKYTSSIQGRLIAMAKPECSIEVSGNYVTVSIRSVMYHAGIGIFPGYSGSEISVQKKAKLWSPIDKMRINKAFEKL